MNKLKKISLIILVNFIIFVFAIFIIETVTFYTKVKSNTKSGNNIKFAFLNFYPHNNWKMYNAKFYDAKNKKNSILVLGCSIAYGYALDDDQTISAKLNKALNMPVYNFGVPGGGLANTYNILETGYIKENVKIPPKYILYFWMDDHKRRMYQDASWQNHDHFQIYYKNDHGKLKLRKFSIFEYMYFVDYIKNLYFLNNYLYGHFKIVNFINTRINNFAILYLDSISKGLKELYPDSKFIIIQLEDFPQNYFLSKYKIINLEKESGFIFARPDVEKEYLAKDECHPGELYWDKMLPYIIKHLDD